MEIDQRPTIASPDDDPWLWLEKIDDEQSRGWVIAQNEATLTQFGDAQYRRDVETLTQLLDQPDRIPYVARRGDYLYNFWQDADHPRGVWRRTTQESYATEQPAWEELLDLDALALDEQADWVWHGADTIADSHDIAIISLSDGGSDAVCLREFSLTAKSFVENGFRTDLAKSWCDWLDRDTLLICTTLGEDMTTRSGYPRKVQKWSRGTDLSSAEVLFDTSPDSMLVSAQLDTEADEERIFIVEQTGFYESVCWIGNRHGDYRKINLPADVDLSTERHWAVVRTRKPWTIAGHTHPPDTVLGTRLSVLLEGEHDFTVLFEPKPRRILSGFFWCDGRLILRILDQLTPVHEALTPSAKGWTRQTIDGLSQTGVVTVWPMDVDCAESNGDLLAQTEDPIISPAMFYIQKEKKPQLLKKSKPRFSSDGLQVSRHEAVSSDGERIPYTQIGPQESDGNAPIHLSGYGGFRVSILPHYNPTIGKVWLERGGTAVIAHIRGGGEFGTRWHEAGRREGKRLSHDDFAAVAGDLVERGVTVPARIAAEGGSNGGILITNMMTRYPERFGALFCSIPLIDMRRYSKLLAGASWIDEYGDPDKPADWAFLKDYSAYHAAEPGKSYPPILLATSGRDDRVHPGHARKMAAKLQAMGYSASFYEPESGGHGYGKDNQQAARFMALGYRFLRTSIGWD